MNFRSTEYLSNTTTTVPLGLGLHRHRWSGGGACGHGAGGGGRVVSAGAEVSGDGLSAGLCVEQFLWVDRKINVCPMSPAAHLAMQRTVTLLCIPKELIQG